MSGWQRGPGDSDNPGPPFSPWLPAAPADLRPRVPGGATGWREHARDRSPSRPAGPERDLAASGSPGPGAGPGARWPLRTGLPLGALVTAPSCARLHVRAVLAEWGLAGRADTAELLVSELVTNAVRACARMRPGPDHPGPPVCHLRMVSDGASVVISVRDASDELPARRETGPDAEGGRGLLLVESLSHDWGAYPADPGKVVWVSL